MGPLPRSLTAEANSCFMVRVLHGPNRIQGCGASIAPERGLPSDQLYRTSNNEGHRVAVTLDTKVLIQGCVKTRSGKGGAESFSQLPSSESSCQHKPTFTSTKSRWKFYTEVGHRSFHTAWVKRRNTHPEQMFSALHPKADSSRTSRHVRFVPTSDISLK